MNKIELKCGGFIHIEPLNQGAEPERCKIYDELGNYLDYIYVDCEEAETIYNNTIEYLSNLNDIHEYLESLFRSYDCGNSLEDLYDSIVDTVYWDYTLEELEDFHKEYFDKLEKLSEKDFCAEYMINKIGNLYVLGDD